MYDMRATGVPVIPRLPKSSPGSTARVTVVAPGNAPHTESVVVVVGGRVPLAVPQSPKSRVQSQSPRPELSSVLPPFPPLPIRCIKQTEVAHVGYGRQEREMQKQYQLRSSWRVSEIELMWQVD
jgi:hypothetical protein